MTLQTSGQISAQDIIVEEAIQIVNTFNINTTLSRTLAKRPSGQIAFSDFYGKTNCAPGSIIFDTPGVYKWTIPTFGSLTVNAWGAGGGGGGDAGNGGDGGPSIFYAPTGTLIAGGGGGGYGMAYPPQGTPGYGGQPSGGSTNISGQNASGINGGASAIGAAGGTGGVYFFLLTGRLSDVHHNAGTSGSSYGGGGGATNHTGGKFYEAATGGGGGAFASRSYQPYELPANSTVQIIVGDRGIGADSPNNAAYGYGGTGAVHIDWNCTTTPPAPQIPRDAILGSYCSGYALYYTLYDGNDGSYNQLVDAYSPACGYVADPDIPPCFPAGTQITLADGSKKAIEHITYNDDLRVWDFDQGKQSSAKPAWIKRPQSISDYNHARFADGTELKTVGVPRGHRVFCADTSQFEFMGLLPVGSTVVKDGTTTTLTSVEHVHGMVTYYNIITEHHMNLYANDVLTSTGFNNLYPIKDMKFTKEAREPRTYKGIAEYWISGLRLAENTTTDVADMTRHLNMLDSLKLGK